MTEIETFEALLARIGGGRASAPNRHGAHLRYLLDITGLSRTEGEALADRIANAVAEVEPGLSAQPMMTAQRTQRRLIAVGSGKGGVGKSTLAANLAIALAMTGRKVGMVDADIYGPSQPMLLSAPPGKPEAEEKKMFPVATPSGVPLLSMGQLVDAGTALAWRGPMATSALGQLVDAHWRDTDTLVVDLPPGTGDVQLTMLQKHKPAGAVIVSTPQDLALIDATRAIDLFRKAQVPIIGLVENMAGYACPHCGEISDPFGAGGAEAAAKVLGIPFLGRVPLAIAIRSASDAGNPPALWQEGDGAPFHAIAQKVAAFLDEKG